MSKPDIIVQDRSELGILVHFELDDAGLTPAEFRIYAHLARRAAKQGRAWPGRDSMAETCCMSKRTVTRAIQALEDYQMLAVTRAKGQRSIYVLTKRSSWVVPGLSTDPASFGTGATGAPVVVPNRATKSTKEKENKNLSHPGSELEVIHFTQSLGLPDEDGHYFWSHWESNGFTNNRKPMKNWQATIRSWKLAGHCPSQKGSNARHQKPRTDGNRNTGTANEGRSSQYAGVGKVR